MKIHSSANGINSLWASLIIEELLRHGIELFCISPGSRSTPLVSAVAENKQAECLVHFDERGTAYHALGHARATGKPAVLICTSGTAVANYFPAVVEAAMDSVPLIILSADRPPELYDCGSNQTINQSGLFGQYTRWHFDLPCPDRLVSPQVVLTTIDQAVSSASDSPGGPVHINCRYREPLSSAECDEEDFGAYLDPIRNWLTDDQAHTSRSQSVKMPSSRDWESFERTFGESTRPLIVVGRMADKEAQMAMQKIATALPGEIIADIGSGIRLGATNRRHLAYYDLALQAEGDLDLEPDMIIQIGERLTSKSLLSWLNRQRPKSYYHFTDQSGRTDPDHKSKIIMEGHLPSMLKALSALFLKMADRPETKSRISAAVEKILHDTLDAGSALSEPAVARLISRYIDPEAALFLGNSMPIRDMNSFAVTEGRSVPIATNRGASGIDGIVASAAGFARGINKRTVLVLGDISLLHDLNSLAMLKVQKEPMVIVVINNNGGGIFSYLPVSRQENMFERFFVAPHYLNFKSAAEMFGLDYHTPVDSPEFIATYNSAQKSRESSIIEVTIDRHAEVELRKSLIKQIETVLSSS